VLDPSIESRVKASEIHTLSWIGAKNSPESRPLAPQNPGDKKVPDLMIPAKSTPTSYPEVQLFLFLS